MNKQTGKNFTAQILAFAVNFCVSFFLTPVILERLGDEAYGFVGLANNFIDYAQVFTVAINSLAGRFITISVKKGENENASKYFTSVFFANLFMSAVFTAIFSVLVVFLDKLFDISPALVTDIKLLWLLIGINFVITLFASVYSVSTFIADRYDKTAVCNTRGSIIKGAALLILYNFFPVCTFFVGVSMVLVSANNLISNIIYKRTLTPMLKVSKKYFDIKYVKELVTSGIWNSVTKLSSILSSGLDLLITGIFISEAAMGVFNTSKVASNQILLLFGMLAAVFAPQLTYAFAANDYGEMKKQLISSVKLLGLFSSIPIAVLFAFGKQFYTLWVPTEDSSLLYILTLITSFNLIFALPLEPLYNIFTVKNKIKVSSIALILFSSASILTVFVGLNFIEDQSARIIYIASVGAFYNVLRLLTFLPIYGAKCLETKKTFFYPVILRNVVSVAVLTGIAMIVGYLIPVTSWLRLIICCFIVGITGLITNALTLYTKQEIKDGFEYVLKFAEKLRKR